MGSSVQLGLLGDAKQAMPVALGEELVGHAHGVSRLADADGLKQRAVLELVDS